MNICKSIIGGIRITSEIDFSQFFCWNKDCPDYGINNQGNIVLKERYGKRKNMVKTTMRFLNVKLVKNVLVKREIQYFSNLTLLKKKF
ncbi:hypothetical protein MSVAZ_1878 [Methanosarcina vacuolata Z-761]|uniref:Uncharacterized protein n=1 Tax=Methanosarcina vacuolata Z-761 TaxID=1434123 RepID=A0A0E3Q608_9EURY|nr:hypothetical protein MSVAZ_1878 [Methanosarcina vacuolata Z-761]